MNGVPASGVSGVVLNVTVTEPTMPGHLTVWPSGEPKPLASSLNFVRGQTVPNMVMAKVGGNGRVSFYNSAGTSHVVVDLLGYFSTTGAGGSQGVAANPKRLLDTRPANALGPGASRNLAVGDAVPTGTKAVVLNVTVTEPTNAGHLTVWPAGATRPIASNLNFRPGQTVPNQVICGVGSGNQITMFNSAGATHVVVDLIGWYL
jgi:hypothetical protein